MQLVEASSFAVRSVVIRLQRRGTPMRFVLFPMIHFGSPTFYDDVMTRLRDCHIVVAEGVGKNRVGQALTLTYSLTGRARASDS
jgi:hypothetical protein